MLSLLMVIFVGIVTIFSESPASLYAIDVVIVLGVVALSGILIVLLGRAART